MIEYKKGDDGVKELHSKILAWQKWLTFFAAALITSYVFYFGLLVGQPRGDNYDKWGAFGDFFGGILNPIVAFAAFYWLTQSVKLQKSELADTRRELQAAANAQRELVVNARNSLELSALTALVKSCEVKIDSLDMKNGELMSMYRVEKEKSTDLTVGGAYILDQVRENEEKQDLLRNEMDIYFEYMKNILETSRATEKVTPA